MTPDADAPEEVAWAGRFVVAKRRGRWEYVSRVGDIRAVVILAIDDEPFGEAQDGDVILADQYRVPLGKRCLELPAGLIGDDGADESAEDAAARELAEETGYRAERFEALGEFYSSPGLASESFTLVRASGLSRVGDGGGTGDEDIRVHRVPLSGLADYVAARRDEGMAIDVKLLLLLGAGMLGDQRKLSA